MQLTNRQKRFIVASYLVTNNGTGRFTHEDIATRLGCTPDEAGDIVETLTNVVPVLYEATLADYELTGTCREWARELIEEGFGEGLT